MALGSGAATAIAPGAGQLQSGAATDADEHDADDGFGAVTGREHVEAEQAAESEAGDRANDETDRVGEPSRAGEGRMQESAIKGDDDLCRTRVQ